MNERIDVGFEPNKPRIMMVTDANGAKIVLTENADVGESDEYYVLLIAGKHPQDVFKSAGITIKEGANKLRTISTEFDR